MKLINLIKNKQPWCHFSVDDAWRIFRDRGAEFEFLKSLYDDFGVVTSLYIFTEPKGKKYLSSIPTGHMKDYPWIKIGPHAPNWNHPLNTLTGKEQIKHLQYACKEIKRIGGSEIFAKNVRLHFYKGSKEACQFLVRQGCEVLFTQDYWDERLSYCLLPNSRKELNKNGWYHEPGLKMDFIKTGSKVEFRKNIKQDTLESLKKFDFVVFYTHADQLADPTVQKKIRTALEVCRKKNVLFVA